MLQSYTCMQYTVIQKRVEQDVNNSVAGFSSKVVVVELRK